MKRVLVLFCGWLVLASAHVRVYALAGDLEHPSLALPANAPAELHGQLVRILDDKDAKFLRGHFVNAHTTLEYGGSTDALNQMLSRLSQCEGVRVILRFVRTAGGASWTLDHNAWGDARSMNIQINVASPSIKLEDLTIPALGTGASDKVATPTPRAQPQVEKNSR
ncbi:MAG: hypothetical protein AB9869_17970 [Verrucomicrobiia bacterium]